MNIERLEFIRDYLLNPPRDAVLGFNMSDYRSFAREGKPDMLVHKDDAHSCGTVCCIAGLAEAFYRAEGVAFNFWGSKEGYDFKDLSIGKVAQAILGLDEDQSRDLFLGSLTSYHLSDITPEDAAFAINRLLKNGAVSWEDPQLLNLASGDG